MFATPNSKARTHSFSATPLSGKSLSQMSVDSTPGPLIENSKILENLKTVFQGDQSEAGLHFNEVGHAFHKCKQPIETVSRVYVQVDICLLLLTCTL